VAIVGFGRSSGRPVPETDGIVVAAAAAAAVAEAHAAWVEEQARLAANGRHRRIVGKWGALVQKAITRARLREEYGAF